MLSARERLRRRAKRFILYPGAETGDRRTARVVAAGAIFAFARAQSSGRSPPRGKPRPARERPSVRPRTFAIGLGVAAVLVAGVVIFISPFGTKHRPATTVPGASGVTQPRTIVVTEGGLAEFAKKYRHPVYWVGAAMGADYEITTSPDGRVFVRYLAASTPVDSPKPTLSVGTYPLPRAFEATAATAKKKGFVRIKTRPNAIAIYLRTRPTNIYVALRGVDLQIELFDPKPAEGRRLVGRLGPAG